MGTRSGLSGYFAQEGVRQGTAFFAVMFAGFLVSEAVLRVLGLAQGSLARVVQVLALSVVACVLIALRFRAVRRREAGRALPPARGPPDGVGLAPPFFLGSVPALAFGSLFVLIALTSAGTADFLLWTLLSLAFVRPGVVIVLMGSAVRSGWAARASSCVRS